MVSLGWLDIALFLLSLATSVIIGIYFAAQNKNLNEYMLGGRNQKLLPVSLSMMTSFVSGLTLIGNPVEFYYHGIGFALEIIACLLSVPISALILLPVFYRLGGVSIFELNSDAKTQYLELRFDIWCKRIVSASFMITMVLYNAVVLYVPSLSLKSVLGISETISIGVVGFSCLVYCTLGGIKAVIWTDFFQAGLMYVSLLCICFYGTLEVGSVKQVFQLSLDSNRLDTKEFFTSVDLTTRHTIYNLVTGVIIVNIFMNGANQIQVQRALSLPNLRQGQWSLLLSSIFTILISFICSYVGLILYAVFANCDPFESHSIDKRDALLIYYVANHLAHLPGLRGVFVAGIFASTLSTLSSFQNSMSALMLEDFIKPILVSRRSKISEQTITYLGKLIALLFGLLCIGLTFLASRISGLLQVAYTLFGILGGPLSATFLLGMLTRFTNAVGIMWGLVAGFLFGAYIQCHQLVYLAPLEPTMSISTSACRGNFSVANQHQQEAPSSSSSFDLRNMAYFWLPFFSFALTALVASCVSLVTGGLRQEVDNRYLVSWLHTSHQARDFCQQEDKQHQRFKETFRGATKSIS